MRHYLIAGIGGVLAGTLVTTQIAGPLVAQEAGRNVSVYEQLELFGNIFERIRSDYVEVPDDRALIEAAINGMLTSLDPHSGFLSADAYSDMRTQTRGSFGGLGIEVSQEDGLVRVVSPIDDTPAAEAGVQAGDFITHVDGESLLGLTLDQAVDMMRGPVGSEITITILREGEAEPFDLTMTRDTIKLTVVRSRIEGNAVILRISTFNDETYDALRSELARAVQEVGGIERVDGFVLDLRNNPGGLLNQAISVSDAFLDAGEIVSTRGRRSEDSERWNAEPGDLAEGRPIVVLINGGSASASEIVTGALQDHRRAIVVGEKSFGKGSVQTVMPVTADSAIRLTTARYYTPAGRSIQAMGIQPDILVAQPRRAPQSEEGESRTQSSYSRSEAELRGALGNEISDEQRQQMEREAAELAATAALREEDYQLAYAVDILRGLAAVNFRASQVPASETPAVTGEGAAAEAESNG
ncbi:MAG: S41 family peptidase [Paracoccus sp. (in: a-proteobacteria)]|nr:S41 family peptidase [Paracoccus sp. (in: a-proteobacteria)]